MTASPAPSKLAPRARVVAPLLLVALGVFGMSAIWTLVALMFDRQCAWIAAIAAADLALLLRLGQAAPGMPWALTALAATLATILISNWTIAATQMGGPMGLPLLDSVQRLGTDHERLGHPQFRAVGWASTHRNEPWSSATTIDAI